MATQLATPTLDLVKIRADFPILSQPQPEGRGPLVFLDSAASSQKPQIVIDTIDAFYREANSNIHRGVYHLSEVASGLYESARATMATFIGAADPREIVFVRNTTEA
ncbi:MAG TPA: aminotransferase class V-fold PLP-dependent enzyme, partial [Thermomicrobiales bacterium]|nr:aminotransferase class V-fold PLP-dependent enzyme [Thermomicrobiales bacterium]